MLHNNYYNRPTPEFAIFLMSYLPERTDYDSWLRVISAIGNTFPEDIALRILGTHWLDEKCGEMAYKLAKRLDGISFGSLIYEAEKYGYKPDKHSANGLNKPISIKQVKPNIRRQPIVFDDEPKLTYKFLDYEYEERAGILEFEGNMTRLQAESKILSEFPNAASERAFRIAINDKILNKNLDPMTKKPYNSYNLLTKGFKNHYLTSYELASEIGKGRAICCCHLKDDIEGNTIRKTENWVCSDLFAVDIDEGKKIDEVLSMSMTRKALLLYTSHSHTDDNNRFRIIFSLPRLIKNKEHFEKIVQHFIKTYHADIQCKDAARAYYGNNNATIINIQTGEIMKFHQGELI